MRKSTLSVIIAATLGSVIASSANAFVLTSGNSSVTGNELGLSAWTVDGVNHLYAQNWWFNASSSAGSTPFNYELADYDAAPTETPNGSNNLLQQFQVLGFDVNINYTVAGGSVGSGSSGLTENITITNTTANAGTFTLFQYTDFDLGGPSSYNPLGNNVGNGTDSFNYGQTDLVTQEFTNTVSQTNGIWAASEIAVSAPSPTLTSIGQAVALEDALFDGTVTGTANFSTFTGDAAWIWQYDFTIAAGGTASISKALVLETTVVPVPAAVWLFGSGLIGLVGIARRRV